MISWIKKAGRTRTDVDSRAAMLEERQEGLRLCRRNACAIMLAVQLLLWLTLFLYDRQQNLSWISAGAALLPLAATGALWYFAARKGALSGARARTALILIPCLWLDVFLCMAGSVSMLEYYIPTFPAYGRLLMVVVFPLLTAWLSRGRGIAYGLYPLRYLFLFMFALSTVLSGADVSLQRLAPLRLPPWPDMGRSLYTAAGAVWPVCLMFLLPAKKAASPSLPKQKRRFLPFLILPMVLLLIWALWMSMLRPWEPSDPLVPAQKLTAISRYGGNMLMSQLGSLLWTSVLPAAVLCSLYAGQHILRAALPKAPGPVFSLLLILPPAALHLLPPPLLTRLMEILLPLRFLPALICGIVFLILPPKEAAS
jgi:hypothetical protein